MTPIKFENYQLLSRKLAYQFMRRVGKCGYSVTFDDAYAEVCFIWVKARNGFDPNKGFAFATYFMRSVVYEVKPFIASLDEQRNERNAVRLDAKAIRDSESNSDSDFNFHEVVSDQGIRRQDRILFEKESKRAIANNTKLLGKLIELSESNDEDFKAELRAAKAHKQHAQAMGIKSGFDSLPANSLTPGLLAEVFCITWPYKQLLKKEIAGALEYVS